MSHPVQMPALGESVTEGTVTRWLKAEGDRVEVDEPLLEVSTDKVDTEIPSPVAGVLEKILIAEDETAEVGAELARIGDGSGASSAADPSDTPSASDTPPASDIPDTSDSSDTPQTTAGDAAPGGEPTPEPEAVAAPEEVAETPSTDIEEPAAKPVAQAKPTGGAGTSVVLPAMGESVTEGTVTRWLKQVGDPVEVDDPLVEVSTDKVDTEIPSPVAGTLLKISAGEDETIEVGGELAVIGEAEAAGSAPEPEPAKTEPAKTEPAQPEPAEAEPAHTQPETTQPETTQPEPQPEKTQPAPAAAAPRQSEPTQSAPAAPAAPPAGQAPESPSWQPQSTPSATSYVTPVIRKLAADAGVDLATVSGTGVGGRIRREDVTAAAQAAKEAAEAATKAAANPAPPAGAPAAPARSGGSATKAEPSAAASALIGTTVKMPRIRQSIAKNMLAGLRTAAQLTTVIEVDATRIAALRTRAKAGFAAREGVSLSFLPFFVKAAVEALKAYPVVNSSVAEDLKEITYHGSVNLGVAVDTPRGLIVPVIQRADDLNISGIARRIADLAARTRDNKIGPDELSGGTFTITNTGSVGALFDTPIFVPPQSAILGTGAIVKRPMVIADADGNDVIAVRSMAYLALSYDHRSIDGADASRFLQAVRRRVEAGDFEGELGL